LLLLIACANVSNLLLSRASARQREMTVRAALGAGRGRLVRQLLTESLVLSLAAGLLGTLLAYAGLPALLSLVPPGTIPDEAEIALNLPVLGFALAVATLTSLVCGLAPALHSSRRDLAASMREVTRSLAGGSRQAVLRRSLVVGEVALSLMLLAGSSVLLRAFIGMQRADLPVEPQRVVTMRVPLPPQRYPDTPRRVAFFQELLRRIEAVPGVAAAGVNSGLHPLGTVSMPADVAGEAPGDSPVEVHNVSAGYTSALGIRLAQGRLLTETDVNRADGVALVNERFVRTRLTGGANALGRVVRLPRLAQPPISAPNVTFQIVGVVHDTLNAGLTAPVVPEMYVPFSATGVTNLVVVRTQGDPAGVIRPVISQVYAIDSGQPVTSVMTLESILHDEQLATPKFNLILLSIFATVGLALAVVGVYGVMASAVAQEQHEIGIRLALGADAGVIARMVIRRGARLLVAGTILGLAGSAVAGRFLGQQVWGVAGFDPLAFAAVAAVLMTVGLLACAWPARRAARVDPIVALRLD
jgi:putative ABC transport system permease protein